MHRQEGRGAARERGGTARRGRAPPEEGASRQEGGGRHQETGGSARRGVRCRIQRSTQNASFEPRAY